MKKYLSVIIFFNITFWAAMATAKQINMPTYYASSGSSYTKLLFKNGAGGVSASTTFCLGNAGAIFTDPNSSFLEICKSDGSFASYPGACFNRFTTNPPPYPCPGGYLASNRTGTPFSGVASYSCCLANDATNFSKTGCFAIFSNGTGSTPANWPASCFSIDPNAYDVGCHMIRGSRGKFFERDCCFNSGTRLLSSGSPCS